MEEVTVVDLERALLNRNKAEEECWKAIREDSKVSDNMASYWKNRQSGAE